MSRFCWHELLKTFQCSPPEVLRNSIFCYFIDFLVRNGRKTAAIKLRVDELVYSSREDKQFSF